MIEDLNSLKELPKILIVDDRETERDILSKLLDKFNAEIHTAGSGQEALSLLIRYNYVLVLLDIQMPIMDGLETARLIRSNKNTENIPIIFLTAYDKDEINMLQGYEVGAIDYLFKPINEDILLSKVKTFLKAYSFEKEKEYEKILTELEKKNAKLQKAQKEAVTMMKQANEARSIAEASQQQIKQQAEDLLRYNKELEQFAYVATHDLRAPIINLNGLLKVFKKRGYVNDENEEVVNKIFSSVSRINETLHDLIHVVAYTKTIEDEVQEIDFDRLTCDVLQDLEKQIKEADAEITLDFEAAPKVHYVQGYARSIIQNLLTNAIKYRSLKRKLKVTITTKPEGNFICLSVADNGMGIDDKGRDKVFGLFQRLTTRVEGKGMGLYIIKSQIESMGGSIDFTSTVDKGSDFKVLMKNLPLNKTENGQAK
ncbi:hybrid sensor histidine kinase/response regulator [Fulvivirga sp. RKSG066]|uniref:sensor histidine kinase n=1 Tax=Fulvivirga aurantia TaxID=2529383 RepID=UPI0012BCCDC3|nr:hybrid sensor histidine kinase/response regulator [Fulvivirga aurantia]MTI23259.1 hybrid sensor histidine kinase/response regulator [Fulvivirga aurantia]